VTVVRVLLNEHIEVLSLPSAFEKLPREALRIVPSPSDRLTGHGSPEADEDVLDDNGVRLPLLVAALARF
jgi:hypothetical protein